MRVFCDGSGYEEQVGAAALVWHPAPQVHLQFYLGQSTAHTVFEAELVGVLLEPHIIRNHASVRTTMIALDSQATIMALRGTNVSPVNILSTKSMLRFARCDVRVAPLASTLGWVPGHRDNPGNEGRRCAS